MAAFTIKRYQPADAPVWNRVARQTVNATFLHQRAYMDYHADRFEDVSLLVERKGQPVALFPAEWGADIVRSHGGLTYGGLLVTAALDSQVVLQILDAVAAYYTELAPCLQIAPVPGIYRLQPDEADLFWLWRHGALVGRGLSTVLIGPLQPTASRTRQLHQRPLVQYRRAAVAEIYPVIEYNLREHHDRAPVHTEAELAQLAATFPRHIHPWAALVDGDVAAALVIYVTHRVAHLQYIAQTGQGRETRAQDGLIAYTRRHYSRLAYDFGVSTENGGRVLNEGLLRYKESFGGRSIGYDTWEVAL